MVGQSYVETWVMMLLAPMLVEAVIATHDFLRRRPR